MSARPAEHGHAASAADDGVPDAPMTPGSAGHVDWLQEQCAQLDAARAAVLFVGAHDGATVTGDLQPVALWPDAATNLEALIPLVEQVVTERCGLAVDLEAQADWYGVALPLEIDRDLVGVVAVIAECADEQALRHVMTSLEWGVAGLAAQFYDARLQRARADDERRRAATDLLATVVDEPDSESAGSRFTVELARLTGAERVSLGYVRRSRPRVAHMSNSAMIGKNMNLVNRIEAAMSEAIDQKQVVLWPPPADTPGAVTRAHEQLAETASIGSVMTVPLFRDNAWHAAITLERHTDNGAAHSGDPSSGRFSAEDAAYVESLAALVAACLEDKRLNDRWLVTKAWDSLLVQAARLVGRGYVVRKLVLLVLLAATIFFALFEADYRLAADATLEGRVQRVIAAPFDGYLERADVKAGDVVRAGDSVAELDERDLQLERYKWKSEQAQRQTQLEDALGARDRAQIRILGAQVEQAAAELELVDSQLARTRIAAPYDGVIVSGDLSQRLGSAVEQGEELFRIAPLNAYRVIMQVPERRIQDVAVGQTGRVLLSALPTQPVAVTVKRITPVTQATEGNTFFRVEGVLTEDLPALRPGMEGIAEIDVDRRLLILIWTRDLVEWLRLAWWTFWG